MLLNIFCTIDLSFVNFFFFGSPPKLDAVEVSGIEDLLVTAPHESYSALTQRISVCNMLWMSKAKDKFRNESKYEVSF